jgi:ABC-type nitrate/sulfonate/bicarbonate transport system ATPase subunit
VAARQPGKAQHPLSFVFQEATLMPWSSVRNNVRLPLDLAGVRARKVIPG